MWVEPDLHAPSGESILRQFAYGVRYTSEKLGVVPDVVWLPDTFGFPNTLPTLAAHAGLHVLRDRRSCSGTRRRAGRIRSSAGTATTDRTSLRR